MKKLMHTIFLLLLFFSFGSADAEEFGWEQNTLAAVPVNSISAISQMGSNGIGITYNTAVSGLVFNKSTNSGRTWGTAVQIDADGTYSDIYCKSSTTCWVSYYKSTTGDLRLAKTVNGGTTWILYVVDSANDVGQYPAMTYSSLAGNDNLYIAYYDVTNTNLRFAKSTDGGVTWTTSNVDTTAIVGLYPSMDIRSTAISDSLVITHYDSTNDDVRAAYSTDDGATWTLSVVYASSVANFSSVKFSPDTAAGNSFIGVSLCGTLFELLFAKSADGSTWTVSYVDGKSYAAQHSSNIIFGNSDRSLNNPVYVIYPDILNHHMKIASSYDSGATWNADILDKTTYSSGAPIKSFGTDSNHMYSLLTGYQNSSYVLKFYRTLAFEDYPMAVQSVSGLASAKSPVKWTKLKDGSAGDNVEEGLLAVAAYEWDGEKFQRSRSPAGQRFFSVKRTNIAASSINLSFGFKAKKLALYTPAANTDEICIDWTGGTAVCPAANTAGDDRIPASSAVILDDYSVSSVSVIAASGTQTVYIRAWE